MDDTAKTSPMPIDPIPSYRGWWNARAGDADRRDHQANHCSTVFKQDDECNGVLAGPERTYVAQTAFA
jgi:hypothetical protein